MKYRKPVAEIERMRKFIDEWVYGAPILAFLDSLPDEFEIVPEGHVCVKWPESAPRKELVRLYQTYKNPYPIKFDRPIPYDEALATVLHALAAIAPERKNPTKRRISVLQFQGHGETYGKLELSFNMAPQFPWVKVGECEIEE